MPIQEALKGNAGYGLSLDYRGKKVIAVWQHIALPDWGIVAKIDVAEAFKPVTTLRNFVFILLTKVFFLFPSLERTIKNIYLGTLWYV